MLEEDQAALVREFISVAKSQGQIESEGVHSSISLLMYGPSRARAALHATSLQNLGSSSSSHVWMG